MYNLLLELMLRLLFLCSGWQAACVPEVFLGLVVSSHVIVYDFDQRLGQEKGVQLPWMRFGWAKVWAIEPQKLAVRTWHSKVGVISPIDRLKITAVVVSLQHRNRFSIDVLPRLLQLRVGSTFRLQSSQSGRASSVCVRGKGSYTVGEFAWTRGSNLSGGIGHGRRPHEACSELSLL